MNNYIFSQDPLLFRQPVQQPFDDGQLKMQLEQAMMHYQNMQNMQPPQQSTTRDVLGELDNLMKTMDTDMSQMLLNDEEYVSINTYIQSLIQEELMKSVRWKINSNPDAVQKIERLKTIINSMSKEKEAEEKRNMAELNDYIKNYSSLTFDEYKRLKNAE